MRKSGTAIHWRSPQTCITLPQFESGRSASRVSGCLSVKPNTSPTASSKVRASPFHSPSSRTKTGIEEYTRTQEPLWSVLTLTQMLSIHNLCIRTKTYLRMAPQKTTQVHANSARSLSLSLSLLLSIYIYAQIV